MHRRNLFAFVVALSLTAFACFTVAASPPAASRQPSAPAPEASATAESAPVADPAAAAPITAPVISSGVGIMGSGGSVVMPPGAPPEMREQFARFERLAEKQRYFRQTLLAGLTPLHRELLGRIVGALAVSPSPDVQGATRAIDAVLAPTEAQFVVRVNHEQQIAMTQEFAQLMAQNGLHNHAFRAGSIPLGPMAGGTSPMGNLEADSDPGAILLRVAAAAIMTPHIQMFGPHAR